MRIPVITEAKRIFKTIEVLLHHHSGIRNVKKVFYTVKTLKDLLNTARKYLNFVFSDSSFNILSNLSHFTIKEYINVAEIMISKQLSFIINMSVPILTKFPSINPKLQSEIFENEIKSNNKSNNTKNISLFLPIPLQEAMNSLQTELNIKREWLIQEEQQQQQQESQLTKQKYIYNMMKETEILQTQREIAEQEAKTLEKEFTKVKIQIQQEIQNKKIEAKEEERLNKLELEYAERMKSIVKEKEIEAKMNAKEKKEVENRLQVIQKERDELLNNVELLTEQLAEAVKKQKEEKEKEEEKARKKEKSKRNEKINYFRVKKITSSKSKTVEEARAENSALRNVLYKLHKELEEEDIKDQDLTKDLLAFYRDINELEKRKILLEVEYSMLKNTSTVIKENLKIHEKVLNQEQKAIIEERRKIPTRLLVQKERTKKTILAKEETSALLQRLKTNLKEKN